MEPGTAIRWEASLCRKAARDAASSDACVDMVDAALKLEALPVQERDFGTDTTARGCIRIVRPSRAQKAAGLVHPRFEIIVSDRLDALDRLVVIAHELGHYHLHRANCLRDGFGLDTPTMGYSPRQSKEIQADLFADEFLCPSHELRVRLATQPCLATIASDLGLPPDLVRRQAVRALLRPPTGVIRRPEPLPDRNLNAKQQACVSERTDALLAVGKPGCGKTTTLANRALRLVAQGQHPASIMILAATRQAADRLHAALAQDDGRFAGETWFGTADDLAFEIIARFPEKARLTEKFKVMDRVAQTIALQAVTDRAGLSATEKKSLRHSFDAARLETDHPPERISCRLSDVLEGRPAAHYQELLNKGDAVDGAGLVPLAIEVLRASRAVASSYRKRFRHLLIDDLHDVPAAALPLLQRIFLKGEQVFATGNPSQAIERFRSRSAVAMEVFARRYGAKTVRLDQNFRSVEPIVAAVATLDRDAPPRGQPPASSDARLTLDVATDVGSEADLVARRVRALRETGVGFADQVVLAWSHSTLKVVARSLRAKGVPIKFLDDLKSRPETSALLAVARRLIASDPKAPVADRLKDCLFAKNGHLAPLLRAEDAADTRMSLLAWHHLLRVCEQHDLLGGGDLADLEARIDKIGALDERSHFRDVSVDALDLDAVSLLTIHAARGKQFRVVHLPGLHRINGSASSTEDDEAAVLRVAFSRACERLHLSRASKNAKDVVLPGLPDIDRLAAMPTSLALLRR